ncbi:metal ABC transporter permease [Micromonospora sp. NPDC005113]
MQSTWKKSQASMVDAWVRRNRQVVWSRGRPACRHQLARFYQFCSCPGSNIITSGRRCRLVGSILTVSPQDLVTTAVALVVVAAILLACARPLQHTGFDRTGAQAAGFATGVWDVVLLLTIQLVVVTIVPAVGTILALALIVAPAAAARQWSHRLSVITALAVTFGALSGLGGLYASSRWNVAAGASITLTATAVLALSTVLSRLIKAGILAVTGSVRSRHEHRTP